MGGGLTWDDLLTSFVYPPCLLAGLFGGLVTRRWYLAVIVAALVAAAGNAALSHMFSDAPPHISVSESAAFAAVGGTEALLVWAIALAARKRRTSGRNPG